MTFKPISSTDQSLITQWFTGDSAGQKELGFYMDFDSWFNRPNTTPRFKWIVYKDAKPIGFVDLETYKNETASFSFYIDPVHRGKGLSKELLRTLIDKAYELGVVELFAGVEESNLISQKALSSVGFIEDGRDKDNYLIFKMKLEIIIRSARSEDTPQLSRLKRPKDEEHRRNYQVAAQTALEKVKTEDAIFLVIENKNEIVGQVLLRLKGNETEPGYPNMQDLYIVENKRSQGLGKQLIQKCEQIAKEKGYEKISVAVNPTLNPRAKSLYEKLGYKDVGRESYLDGVYDGDEDWVIDLVKIFK